MDVGLTFPQMTPDLDRARVRARCRAVDDGPFSSISAGERIAFDDLAVAAVLEELAWRS